MVWTDSIDVGAALLQVAVGCLGVFGAGVLHELVHAGMARLLGAPVHRIRVGLQTFAVEYSLPEGSAWRARAINLAPLGTGIAVACAALLAGWRPPPSLGGLFLVLSWANYSRPSASDLSLRVARGEEWWWSRLETDERLLVSGSLACFLGLVIYYSRLAVPAERVGAVVWYLGVLWMLVGLAVIMTTAWGMAEGRPATK